MDLKSDFYSTGNSASFIEDSNNEANKIDLDTSESSKNSNLGDVIKSKVSNVFKLVDWSSSSSSPSVATSPIQSETASEKQLSLKHRRHHRSRNSVKQQKQSDIEEDEYKERQIQLSELLQIDFGMPFNLFSEFNILHPYLSLYYLDYFTMVNKMSTKLFCTTSLMMSMMTEANRDQTNEDEKNESTNENAHNSSGWLTKKILKNIEKLKNIIHIST